MEDGVEALESVEGKLASVFASEVAREQGAETPEPQVAEGVESVVTEADGIGEINIFNPDTGEEFTVTEAQPEVEAQDGPLRDPETGQFTTEEKLYAGRYKTVEELERAVEEKEQFIQRQANDVGTLRQEMRELLQAQQQPLPAQPSLPSNFEDLIDEDPAEAAERAYSAGDQEALGQVFRAWNEVYPGAPRLWVQNKQLQEQIADVQQTFGRTASESAYQAFARTHPDVDQHAESMSEIAQSYPFLTEQLKSGDAKAQTEVLDFLYTKATAQTQARNADTLARAQTAADAERQEQIRQAKETAAVASAAKAPAEKKPLNEGQKMLQMIRSAYDEPDLLSGITTD